MKTPRDILFASHQAAAPKLNAIRRAVVNELNHQGTKEQSFPDSFVSSLLGCLNLFGNSEQGKARRCHFETVAEFVTFIRLGFRDCPS